jgi:membrane dipeptidase
MIDLTSIHFRTIAIDMHADSVQRIVDEGVDLNSRLADGHFDAVRMREGGLNAQFFSIWVEPEYYGAGGKSAVARADIQIAALWSIAEKDPSTWEVASTANDIRRIAADGRLSILMGLEGGYAIDDRLEYVERFYQKGVRYMSPAWNVSLSWAGSCADEIGSTRGLNALGKEILREMNRLGMMIDVSHVSDRTFWDIIETSTKPIIATHSNARAIANVPRNLDDNQLRALSKTGGVCCVVFYPEFIEPGWKELRKQVDSEIEPIVVEALKEAGDDGLRKRLVRSQIRAREYKKRMPPVTVARLVDHIDHIVNVTSIDSVGIGSDFDGILSTLQDLSSVSELPNLTNELLIRGYSELDITKILGGNVLRLMEANEGD